MPILGISRKLRELKRSREIANILIKHGFGHIIERIELKFPFKKVREIEGVKKIPIPVRVRMVLEELGPTFVKFGQILSMRSDLIPEEFVNEFRKLQDDVPSFPYEDVENIVREEFGSSVSELFHSFEKEPIASASIGQVHSAVLKNGEEVVVKVQRPGIEETIESDLDILFNLARLIARHMPESRFYDPVGIVEEFATTIRKELDYLVEGRHVDRFARNFESDKTIYVPTVYWDLTTRKVLTMEAIHGTKISELDKSGISRRERRGIADNIARSYMKQIFVDGYFHADPHLGNIFVMADQSKVFAKQDKQGINFRENFRIGFMDFGIMGWIDNYMKEKLANLLIAIIQRDTQGIVDEFLDIGMAGEDTDVSAFRTDIGDLIDEYYGTKLEQIQTSKMMNEIMNTAIKNKIKLPANFALLIKTLVTMEGLCRELSPEFNMTEVSKPFVESIVAERMHPRRLISKFIRNLSELNDALITLPKRLNQIMSKLQRGQLVVDLEHKGLDRMISEIDLSSNRLSVSMIISALIIGSSLIMQIGKGPLISGFPTLGLMGFLIAGFLGILLVISILRSGRF